MTILLWMLMMVALVALVVTIHAVVNAKDGFEDAAGFHAVAARGVMDSDGACGSDRLLGPSLSRTAPVMAARAAVR